MLFGAAILGFACGFVGSIPVAGPIALLVFSRGLQDRARSALYLGSGAAVAESAYAYLAFQGFAEVATRYAWIEPASRFAAAVLLTGLGFRFASAPGACAEIPIANDRRAGDKRSFLLGLTLTALNPVLIAVWAAAVAALYSLDLVRFDRAAALPFSLGACFGITAWFATLLVLLQRFRRRVSREAIDRAIRAMGLALIALGLGLGVRFAARF